MYGTSPKVIKSLCQEEMKVVTENCWGLGVQLVLKMRVFTFSLHVVKKVYPEWSEAGHVFLYVCTCWAKWASKVKNCKFLGLKFEVGREQHDPPASPPNPHLTQASLELGVDVIYWLVVQGIRFTLILLPSGDGPPLIAAIFNGGSRISSVYVTFGIDNMFDGHYTILICIKHVASSSAFFRTRKTI